MKIAIFGRVFKEKDRDLIQNLFKTVTERAIKISIHKGYLEQIYTANIEIPESIDTFEELKTNPPDLLISIGGDGTLLQTLSFNKKGKIPVLGINTGRLGFLTSINRNEIVAMFKAIEEKAYYLEKRTMLVIKSTENLFGEVNIALNECAIMKSESTSMITVHTYLDGEFLNSYWADGLIIATPTGSTGYSLSCGGPILMPSAKSLVLTPIAPHNLNLRPLVIADDKVISLKVEGRSAHFLCTMDSRYYPVNFSTELTVHKAPVLLKMLRLKDYSFLRTIRDKLMWGADRRNQ